MAALEKKWDPQLLVVAGLANGTERLSGFHSFEPKLNFVFEMAKKNGGWWWKMEKELTGEKETSYFVVCMKEQIKKHLMLNH